jgi:hypothetical protein
VAQLQEAQQQIAALRQQLEQRPARTQLPKPPKPSSFTGDKGSIPVDEWLNQMETRLALHTEDPQLAVGYAAAWLEGTAALWWRNEQASGTASRTWQDFKTRLVQQFQPLDPVITARQQLRRTQQTGPVAKYVAQLRAVFLRIPGMSEQEKLERFKEGLKYPMLVKVVEADAPTFEEAARVAERADAVSYSYARSYGSSYRSNNDKAAPMELGTIRPNKSSSQTKFKITPEEYERRKRDRLCYSCGKKGHPAALCPSNKTSEN